MQFNIVSASGGEVSALRIGTGKVAAEVELALAALDEKRHLAGDQSAVALGYQEPEIVPLDMREQHILACFGKMRRQIDHASHPVFDQQAAQQQHARRDKDTTRTAVDPYQMATLK